jgi:hypothetical protein
MILRVAFFVGLSAFSARSAPGWASYEWYQPSVERTFVVNPVNSPLQYNHDSSVAWFQDRWFCLWNANTDPREGRPGQLNYMATSRDGKVWTAPVPAFASADHAENPVPCPKGTQWQPNLIVVGDELWAVWSQNSRDEHTGCYVSRLRSPDGKWRNARLLWDGNPELLVEGVRWRVFPTQNPVRLRSGRVLAPVTLTGPQAKDAPQDISSWWAREKRNSVLYSDDLGETWHCSPGTIIPGKSWAQWEPTVWETADGTVLMVARNNDFRAAETGGPKPTRMLTRSESHDGGKTWTPHRFVPVETVASRMHVIALPGDRKLMVHNDNPAGRFVQDRRNLALFFTRGQGVDFVAGPGLTGFEPVVAYPQFGRQEDELLVSYSQGNQPRGIKVARIAPLPRPDAYYVLPRFRELPPVGPERLPEGWWFAGNQSVRSGTVLDVGDGVVTVRARLRAARSGCLVDTRTPGRRSGFVVGLNPTKRGICPFAFVNSPEHNLVADLALKRGGWNTVSVRIDRAAGTVRFEVNGKTADLAFTTANVPPFSGVASIGLPAPKGSRVPGLEAEVGSLEIFREGNEKALCALLAGDRSANVRFPVEPTVNHRVVLGEGGDRQVIRVVGDGSAGLELPDNERSRGDRVEIQARVRVTGQADTDILTVGDGDHWVCLGTRNGQYALVQGDRVTPLPVPLGEGWQTVGVTTGQGTTTCRVGDEALTVPHQCTGTWAYLGRAYGRPRHMVSAWPEFEVELGSLRSRVVRGE